MSIPYIPIITDGGTNAAINARQNGFAFEVTHISFGTGGYVADGTETALVNEVAKVPIAGGGRVAGMLSLVINALLKDSDLNVGVTQPLDIREIGFWNEGVLFAIYANNTVLVRKVAGAYIVGTYSLALRTLQPIDAVNITVVIDESASITLAILGDHLSQTNPHPQYATVLMLQDEATTRANADTALSNALSAEAITRANDDVSLAISIAAEITARENAVNALKSKTPSVYTATVAENTNYDFTLQPYESIRVFMVGGGAEGGRQGTGGSEIVANDGYSSFLGNQAGSLFYVVATGGGKGQGGWYEYQGGGLGVNGIVAIDANYFEFIQLLLALSATKPSYVSNSVGIGGAGAGAIPNHNAGGKGGNGAFVDCIFTNTTTNPLSMRLHAAAVQPSGGNGSGAGAGGICILYREPT